MSDHHLPEPRKIPGVDSRETRAHNAIGFVICVIVVVFFSVLTIVLFAVHSFFFVVALAVATLFAVTVCARWPWWGENSRRGET